MNLKSCFLTLFLFCLLAAHAQEIPNAPTDISPLLIGEKVPDIQLADINGANVSLTGLIKNKPTLLIFYRGGWCPYCNVHLAELQAIEEDVLKLGYQIIAISPDSPENLKATISKHHLDYLLLSDSKAEASRAFGIGFRAPERSAKTLAKSSDNLNPGIMPVPSVFVVNPESEILFEYINPDYKKRIKGSLLLTILNELKPRLE